MYKIRCIALELLIDAGLVVESLLLRVITFLVKKRNDQ